MRADRKTVVEAAVKGEGEARATYWHSEPSLFSRSATGVELVLFDREDDAKPSGVIALDPVANRTYHYWHVFVPGVRPGQIYAYRVTSDRPPSGLGERRYDCYR